MYKEIYKIIKAKEVNMGGIILDQALPIEDITYFDPFLLIHHWKHKYKSVQNQNEVGVGPHPHRGFSPVTLIFEGGVNHQDSLGNNITVEKGGTQWMDSGKGIIHSERPSRKVFKNGGDFEIIQFWVNSPAKNKYDEPRYQSLSIDETPLIISDGGMVKTGIVAGEFADTMGLIKTNTKLLILRFDISWGGKIELPIPEGFSSLIYQLDGKLKINNNTISNSKDVTLFNISGKNIILEGLKDTRAILLAGELIHENVVSYGPFVMNTKEEILDAVKDFKSGKMGVLKEQFSKENA